MRDLNLWTKLFLTAVLAMGLAMTGCPPVEDDDDDATGDDDDATDDDDFNDDDDMTDDDDATDDDDDVVADPYTLAQDLVGGPPSTNCPDCDYTFDVTYTTTAETGTCTACAGFPDGTYTLAYDSDYMYQGQGPYPSVFIYDAEWKWWYNAEAGYNGHTLAFYYSAQDGSYYQYGFWDVVETSMTGYAYQNEP